MRKLIVLCSMLCIAFTSCKKHQSATPGATSGCRMTGYIDSLPYGETHAWNIAYEDGRINKISSGNFVRTYTYGNGYILIKTFTGQNTYSIDSIVLNSNGMVGAKHTTSGEGDIPTDNTHSWERTTLKDIYFYSGDEIQRIEYYYYYKNDADFRLRSISTFGWKNGNCVSWIPDLDWWDSSSSFAYTYTYDTTKAANENDYSNAEQAKEFGALYLKNKNMIISSTYGDKREYFAYTFDEHDRITTTTTTTTISTFYKEVVRRHYKYNCK